ncbi:putative quinol monooxygenase [Alishewanella sp. HL-SH05]|uniref:putative quinol monooxygenase n=1 Tax=Alishewanella sp. HL-SH05 TaxID=3461145 RepID=UPI0040431AB1
MINVIAEIEAKQGCKGKILTELMLIKPLVIEERGCLEYSITQHVKTDILGVTHAQDEVITILEKWESQDDLKSHLLTSHFLNYERSVKDWIFKVNIKILEAI